MKKFLTAWRTTIILCFVILGVALALRLFNLTYLPVFGDEAIYIRWAQVMRAEPTLRFLPLSDGKQPLFMWVVIPFLKIISDPLLAGRVVSVLSGLATTAGIFATTYLIFKSKKAAIFSSFIYAVSPFGVFFDRLALADAMLSAFGVWTLFFSTLFVKTVRLDFAMITGFILGGGLLTKSPALFYALLLPSTWILSSFPQKKDKLILHLFKLGLFTLAALVIGYGMYNILRLGPNFHMVGLRNQDYVFPISHIWENPKDPFIFHVKEIGEWLWMLGPSVLSALVLIGAFFNLKKKPKEVLVLLAWAGIPLFAGAMYAKVFTARYILFSLPYLIVLAGLALELKGKLLQKAAASLFVLFVLHSLFVNRLILFELQRAPLPRSERSGYLEEWTSGYGIRQVADSLREIYQKEGRQIAVGTEGYFGTLPDGLMIYLNDLPEVKIFGVGIIIKDLPQELIDSKKAGNPTYFIINSTRYKGDPEAPGLKLLASYPKGVRPDGTREELLFYEITEASTQEEEVPAQQ